MITRELLEHWAQQSGIEIWRDEDYARLHEFAFLARSHLTTDSDHLTGDDMRKRFEKRRYDVDMRKLLFSAGLTLAAVIAFIVFLVELAPPV